METERILLRYWQESDAEALFKYASDPDVGPRAGWPAHKSVEESREIIRTFFHNEMTWAIVLKETGEAIGCIGYYTHETSNIPIGENDCEVGYWIGDSRRDNYVMCSCSIFCCYFFILNNRKSLMTLMTVTLMTGKRP
jgi:RimJ/RimL family protein N-acetyltransferase